MINIAIDGPAGAGKSTIAKSVAATLGFIYVDTGALYRTVGVAAARRGLDTTDVDAVTAILPDILVEMKYEDGVQKVYLDGEDVSTEIRIGDAGMWASNVSAMPPVRAYLLDLQKKIAAENNVIMDGRDIGTVILPDAELKIFLTASAEVRADRRYKEFIEKGVPQDYDKILEDIKTRDYNDSHREIAPLKQADDAVLIDSSYMSISEVAEKIISLLKERVSL